VGTFGLVGSLVEENPPEILPSRIEVGEDG
jgi:hypothetical protein